MRFERDPESGLLLPRRRLRQQRGCEIYAGPAFYSAASQTDPYWSSVVLLVDASSYSDGTTPSTIDVTGKTPTYVGNAQVKTDAFKFGSSSLYFDGAGDCVYFADSADWVMGEYATWEFWARRDDIGATKSMLSQKESTNSYMSVEITGTASAQINCAVTGGSGGTTVVSGAYGSFSVDSIFHHIAVVRDGDALYGFRDGTKTSIGTGLSTYDLKNMAAPMVIGAELSSASTYPFKGWIDQVRITKGVARYTADFTPPTAAFPHS